MLKIGEFSKLSHLTIKALRFYEKEGILMPVSTDEWTGYRYYETGQLEDVAKISSYRQLCLSIEEIKTIQSGADEKMILAAKAEKNGYKVSGIARECYIDGIWNKSSVTNIGMYLD